MEVYDEFCLAAKSSGVERQKYIKHYGDLLGKSNLHNYLVSNDIRLESPDISEFFYEVYDRGDYLRSKKLLDYYENDANWIDYDPSWLIEIAKKNPVHHWLIEPFSRCTRTLKQSIPEDMLSQEFETPIHLVHLDWTEEEWGKWRLEDSEFDKKYNKKHGLPDEEINASETARSNEIWDEKEGDINVSVHSRNGKYWVVNLEYIGRLTGSSEVNYKEQSMKMIFEAWEANKTTDNSVFRMDNNKT